MIMATDFLPTATNTHWISNTTARNILTDVQFAYPIITLALFLIATTAHGIWSAPKDGSVQSSTRQTGPGGKLKKDTQKMADFSPTKKYFFIWISIASILTFVGNGVLVIVHAVTDKADNWWCGQATVVGHNSNTH